MKKSLSILVILLLANNTQASSLSCEPGQIASRINNSELIVPKKIYHFGKPEHLLEDVEARTIPQKAWDEFIMGTGPRFDSLKSSRRGLYGTASIAYNDFGTVVYSWLMEIQIKDECRKSENVVTPTSIAKSSRFLSWLKNSAEKLETTEKDFLSVCTNERGDLATESFYGPSDKKCDEVFNRYLEDTNVKIVQDVPILQSFYIRDRNCIKTIKGSPKEIIELASKKTTWMPVCKEDVGNSNFREYVLPRAFNHLGKPVPLAVAEKIQTDSSYLNIRHPMPLWLDAYIRCLKIDRFDKFQALQTLMESDEYVTKMETYFVNDDIDALWNSLCIK